MNEESDEMLVNLILKGKVHIFSMIVQRYERPVYNLMYRYCRSEQEAADLSQDVFLRVYNRLSSFDGRKKFFPWLYAVAVNRARDWQRSNFRKRQKLAELCWYDPVTDTVSQQEKWLLGQEEIRILYEALDDLPDITREMVLLRYQKELPISDLAYIFKLSESAVKMRIARAIVRLRSVLGGDRHEGTVAKAIAN
jgi:RNA polymerase sigma-70 factor (ECF subfamily)